MTEKADTKTKGRFVILNMVRLTGLILVLAGIGLSQTSGRSPYILFSVLILIGLILFFLHQPNLLVDGSQKTNEPLYKQVDIVEVPETKWQIMLDGRPVQTASGTAQTVSSFSQSNGKRMVRTA